jgi:hypothetical protein
MKNQSMTHDFEQDAEAFHQELHREYYLAEAGLKEQLDITTIYDRWAHLFTKEAAKRLLDAVHDREGKYLAEWITLEYLENLVKGLTERVSNAMRAATVEWDGEQVPYHNLRPMMANEADMTRRQRLEELQREITLTANGARVERIRTLHQAAVDLGFDSYVTMCDDLRALRLEVLTEQMQSLLRETRDLFYELLEEYLSHIHVPVEAAATCDILALFRGRRFDALFPKEALLPALHTTLSGMGIDLSKQSNLELDTEPRPLKTPRAFCVPLRIPEDVKLVIKPAGGPDDYGSLLHEAGHAEHFAHVDPGLSFPFRRLGDNSVTEGYAFLFEYLLLSDLWLEQVLGIEDTRDYLRFARFQKLWFLRRYGSKLIYEQELHTEVEGADDRYVSILNETLGVAIAAENYLADTDDAFYCAQYLRAWIFEAQLRRFMEDRFGTEWFATPDAGHYLVSLWRRGQELPVEELARDMGYDGLDAKYLTQELVELGED